MAMKHKELLSFHYELEKQFQHFIFVAKLFRMSAENNYSRWIQTPIKTIKTQILGNRRRLNCSNIKMILTKEFNLKIAKKRNFNNSVAI